MLVIKKTEHKCKQYHFQEVKVMLVLVCAVSTDIMLVICYIVMQCTMIITYYHSLTFAKLEKQCYVLKQHR